MRVQIQPLTINGIDIVFVYHEAAPISVVKSVIQQLTDFVPDIKIVSVPFGHPISVKSGGTPSVYICEDDPVTMSAMAKICTGPHEPGRIIPLSKEEYRAINKFISF